MNVVAAMWPGVLLGIYPLLVLLGDINATTRSFLASVILGTAASSAVGIVAWFFASRATRDDARRTLLIALVSVAVFFPGLASHEGFSDTDASSAFVSLWLTVSASIALLVLRSTVRRAAIMATFLRVFAAALASSALISLPKAALSARVPSYRSEVSRVVADSTLPSIYLIITDKYTSSATLRDNYGFDNGAVARELEAKGFVLPRASRPNYVHTFLSLASLLNWSFLDSLTATYGPNSSDREPAYRMIRSSRLVERARARGYAVVIISSAYPPIRDMGKKSERVDFATLDISPVNLWWQQSVFLKTWRVRCRISTCRSSTAVPFERGSSEVVKRKLDTIAALAGRRGPQLVIAHILLPHEPYIFHADCSPRTPYWPVADTGAQSSEWRAAYLEQVQCTNRLLVSLVDRILTRSSRPPVILIQGDHGHGGIAEDAVLGRTTPVTKLAPAAIRDRTSVFAAYFLPGVPKESVSDSITPVNLLPLVLNHYWGEHLPIQSNRVQWSDFSAPYNFVPVPTSGIVSHGAGRE